MIPSPFTFLRGAAVVMAHDLAGTPRTGIRAQLCGDCHLSNFGGYAFPERTLLFDVNDFDETLPGHWEWDVKRLATSVIVAGRENVFDDSDCRRAARGAVASYRNRMAEFSEMGELEVWYSRVSAEDFLAASDIFLGWLRGRAGRDFYWRQLRDMKGAAKIACLSPEELALYARICGWALARAHARSGDRVQIAGYLGKSERFDEAIADFAEAYADQTERDHATLCAAVKSGRIAAAVDA